jgi:membrane-bound metal-dependent hydrolase YbcI (DUF457 family)
MPNKNGHAIVSSVVAGATIYIDYKAGYHFNMVDNLLIPAFVFFGGFYPDFDAEYSFIRWHFKKISEFYSFVQKKVKNIGVLNEIFKHRGALFHSWITILPFVFLFLLTNFSVFYGMAIGILGHHLADMTTPAGLPRWLYPLRFNKRRFSK